MTKHQIKPLIAILPVLALVGCGDSSQAQSETDVIEMVREVLPEVERAVGLPFKEEPKVAVRTREQARAYIDAKMAAEMPPDEIERLSQAYRLFGLIPDDLDLANLMAELLEEQVAGYYEPDSLTFYLISGIDPALARMTAAHELVHALQDQYMPLDSILSVKYQSDRTLAAQAVLEGQATLGSMLALMPGQSPDAFGDLWTDEVVRSRMDQMAEEMPVFAATPRILKDGLIFPYLAGADFVRWFSNAFPDTVPFGPRLPESTEQILRFDRYRVGDSPVSLSFVEQENASHTDDLGQFQIEILLAEWTKSESTAKGGAFGWAGDRFAVFQSDAGGALVWWTVWDDERAAERFSGIVASAWREDRREGYDHTIARMDFEGRFGVVFAHFPEGWARANDLPRVSAR